MDNPDDMEFEPDPPLMRTARGIVVTKAALSEFTGLAPVTIDKAIGAGAPIIAKGTRKTGWQINSAEFFGWYVRTKVADATGDPEAQGFEVMKTRDKAAQARLRELQMAKMEGELVPILEVEKWAANKFGECKSRLHAMESQIAELTDEQRFALRMALTDALADLSGYQVEGEANFDADANAEEFENVDD